MFINIYHPLIQQAIANILISKKVSYLKVKTDKLKKGLYPFEIYLWSYKGLKNANKIKVITQSNIQDSLFLNLLFQCVDDGNTTVFDDTLEVEHYKEWTREKERYTNKVLANIEYKKQTLSNSFNKRISLIEETLSKATDEKITRMKTSELNNCKLMKDNKIKMLDEKKGGIDILFSKIVQGVLKVEN